MVVFHKVFICFRDLSRRRAQIAVRETNMFLTYFILNKDPPQSLWTYKKEIACMFAGSQERCSGAERGRPAGPAARRRLLGVVPLPPQASRERKGKLPPASTGYSPVLVKRGEIMHTDLTDRVLIVVRS